MAFLSVTQFAALHGVTRKAVQHRIERGDIPVQKIGAQYAIEEGTPWPEDKRVKSGKYKDWREKYPAKDSKEE